MTASQSLRAALTANAAFSFCSALVLIVAPELVSQTTGLGPAVLLRVVGVGLALFAADLIHQATRKRLITWRALYASLADFSWVVGSIALAVFFPEPLTPIGVAVVLGIATVVLAFGVWQMRAIDRTHRASQPDAYRHCVMIDTDAPAERLWPLIANFGDIQRYAGNLRSSRILGGIAPAVGTVRSCEDRAGRRWSEECVVFEQNRIELRFLCDAPDFPFPVARMQGGWQVTPTTSGSRIMIWWELKPKNRILAPLLLSIFGCQADRDFPRIVQRMAAHARGEPQSAPGAGAAPALGRLVAIPC